MTELEVPATHSGTSINHSGLELSHPNGGCGQRAIKSTCGEVERRQSSPFLEIIGQNGIRIDCWIAASVGRHVRLIANDIGDTKTIHNATELEIEVVLLITDVETRNPANDRVGPECIALNGISLQNTILSRANRMLHAVS
jgi:hypothetical protein